MKCNLVPRRQKPTDHDNIIVNHAYKACRILCYLPNEFALNYCDFLIESANCVLDNWLEIELKEKIKAIRDSLVRDPKVSWYDALVTTDSWVDTTSNKEIFIIISFEYQSVWLLKFLLKNKQCERLNGLIKKYLNNNCIDDTTIEKISKMKRFAEDRFRDYLLFSTTSTRKPPARVEQRRQKILNLLKFIQKEENEKRVSIDTLMDFDNQLKELTDI